MIIIESVDMFLTILFVTLLTVIRQCSAERVDIIKLQGESKRQTDRMAEVNQLLETAEACKQPKSIPRCRSSLFELELKLSRDS